MLYGKYSMKKSGQETCLDHSFECYISVQHELGSALTTTYSVV